MSVSAEIRWSWRRTPPPGFEEWFRYSAGDSCHAGGRISREEAYLVDLNQPDLEIKRRGDTRRVEGKGLVTIADKDLAEGPFKGRIKIWSGWTSEALQLSSNATSVIHKARWLRRFDTSPTLPLEIPLNHEEKPLNGKLRLMPWTCDVELTQITLPNQEVWWTFGFEAFSSLRTAAEDLRKVAATLAARYGELDPDLFLATALRGEVLIGDAVVEENIIWDIVADRRPKHWA